MKICVIIPSFNEAKTIAGIVTEVLRQGLDCVVIDDGSKDDTAGEAKNSGAVVFKNQKNEGKGASLSLGFYYALNNGYDAVITMDGDGQHLPEEIPSFLQRAEDSSAGIVVGNRMTRRRNMPFVRVLTNKLMSFLISRICKQHIPDSQCGFRLIGKEVLSRLELKTCRYEAETEILISAARSGFKIESVPIRSIYSGEKSQINPIVDTLRFIKFIRKEIWKRAN